MAVIKYEVVNQAALLDALKSELMAAYWRAVRRQCLKRWGEGGICGLTVDAVMVPSNPERNTLAQSALVCAGQ